MKTEYLLEVVIVVVVVIVECCCFLIIIIVEQPDFSQSECVARFLAKTNTKVYFFYTISKNLHLAEVKPWTPKSGLLLFWRSCWFFHLKMHVFSVYVLHKRVIVSKPSVFALHKETFCELNSVLFCQICILLTRSIT